MYNLKHLPPICSLPALPARYVAAFFEIGTILSVSIPVNPLKSLSFYRPLSITNLIPGMVTEVSAIFVARTTFLILSYFLNALTCSLGGILAKSGHTIKLLSSLIDLLS